MKYLKKIKFHSIFTSIIIMIAGLVLLIWPDATTSIICKALGIVSILFGLLRSFNYFQKDVTLNSYNYELVSGFAFASIGIFLFC